MLKTLLPALFVLVFNCGFAQTDNDTLSLAESRMTQNLQVIPSPARYIGIETGSGLSSFRDLATSPRFYSGLPLNFKLSFLKESPERERQFYLQYIFGDFSSRGKYSNVSRVNSFFADYSLLYNIRQWSNSKWNTKAGGKIDFTGNVRNNPSLQNNAYGVEFFGNIMASIQATRDLSRRTPESKKFFFIRYGKKLKTRSVTARFNAGLLNTNFTHGFIYTQQYQVVNRIDVFENYKFHVSGLRFGSTIAFTRLFDRGNGIRWSYNWDAYRTSYRSEGFEMAHHTISFALLFRTK